jgi:hypothetical protein
VYAPWKATQIFDHLTHKWNACSKPFFVNICNFTSTASIFVPLDGICLLMKYFFDSGKSQKSKSCQILAVGRTSYNVMSCFCRKFALEMFLFSVLPLSFLGGGGLVLVRFRYAGSPAACRMEVKQNDVPNLWKQEGRVSVIILPAKRSL